MKQYIRTLLREGLQEAAYDENNHTKERIEERINSMSDEDLSFVVKEKVFDNLNKIENYDFSDKKSLAIELGAFYANPESEFYIEDKNGKGYYKIDDITDPRKSSIGNEFWVIIRKNTIMTFFLRQDNQTVDAFDNADKLNVDYVFKGADSAIKYFNDMANKHRGKDEDVVKIDGVKYMVDKLKNTIYKKNKPSDVYNIDDMIDKLDIGTQEKILDML